MLAGAWLAGELPDLIETATGTARQLHNTLLDARNEERATLLDDQNHPTFHALYQSWAWTTLGDLRPSLPDAPIFHAVLLDLPVEAGVTGR
ncbi:hypothetical protein [Streptomyces griseus]|uniref:hypothetical protein n=1 Tax=Streptomyces griseus TaxID=1911 RepID=UPI003686B0DB